jgi:hypothetical protein
MGLGAEFIADKTTLKECLWLGFNEQSIAAKNLCAALLLYFSIKIIN